MPRMDNSPIKLSVWTEGLNSAWGLEPENPERLERSRMSHGEVSQVVHRIQDNHGTHADCLFVLQYENKRLHLALNSGIIEISDPGNMN